MNNKESRPMVHKVCQYLMEDMAHLIGLIFKVLKLKGRVLKYKCGDKNSAFSTNFSIKKLSHI